MKGNAKMTIMTVRAPDELQSKLKQYANRQGLSRNSLVLHILWEWIEKEKDKQAAVLR